MSLDTRLGDQAQAINGRLDDVGQRITALGQLLAVDPVPYSKPRKRRSIPKNHRASERTDE